MSDAVAQAADLSRVLYAQCWEDADILLEALAVRPGDVCVSIASAGDNTLSLLTRDPARVIAVDMSPAQLACLALRVAAFRSLEHRELLELIGSRPSERRAALYARCREALEPAARAFWDARPADVAAGVGGVGKFERYLGLFRERVLPLVHPRSRWDRLLQGGTPEQRAAFYDGEWNTWRWRLLFRVFFSRFLMARLGRDPSFFRYAEGTVAARILERVRYALTTLDPAQNPYLAWILTGRHAQALPHALREEHFAPIRANLGRLEVSCTTLEDYLERNPGLRVDRWNLSDIFEYLPAPASDALFARIAEHTPAGGRLACWNLFAPRSRPAALAGRLEPLDDLAAALFARDQAFFYQRFVVEEALA